MRQGVGAVQFLMPARDGQLIGIPSAQPTDAFPPEIPEEGYTPAPEPPPVTAGKEDRPVGPEQRQLDFSAMVTESSDVPQHTNGKSLNTGNFASADKLTVSQKRVTPWDTVMPRISPHLLAANAE